jgi:hypothetical protein
MARKVRADRVKASKEALSDMAPAARRSAMNKAAATGRTFPTSGQRARAAQRKG